MIKIKTLTLTLATFATALFLTPSPAHANPGPEAFEGRYHLVTDRLGLCEPTVLVLATGIERLDLILMRWRFIRVNGGKVHFDNDFEKGYSESYTTNDNRIERHWRQYDKIKHAWNREDTSASLSSSGRLHVHSETHGVFDFYTDCTYQRVGDADSGLDTGDIDVGGRVGSR